MRLLYMSNLPRITFLVPRFISQQENMRPFGEEFSPIYPLMRMMRLGKKNSCLIFSLSSLFLLDNNGIYSLVMTLKAYNSNNRKKRPPIRDHI